MSGAISFGGLVSGLDTEGIIDQLIAIGSRPIDFLLSRKSTIERKNAAFKDLNTKFAALEDRAFSLTTISNIIGRKATSANTDNLVATANADALEGTFSVDILQLATSTKRESANVGGQGNGNGGIAVSNVAAFKADTIQQINDNNRTKATEITEGNFFVNGVQINVLNGSTLQSILDDIRINALGGAAGDIADLRVDAPLKGSVIELTDDAAVPITITNGTSNFLSVFNLDTSIDTGGTRVSSDAVDGVRTQLLLDGSEGSTNIEQAIGTGTITINGEGITYNQANDTLQDILDRINQSNAGVTAAFSSVGSGKIVLTNSQNGALSVNVSDTGNLANALGLGVANEVIGQSAQIQIDGGPSQFFNNNTGINPPGFPGLTLDLLKADPGNPVSVTVAADTDGAVTNVKGFIDQYNVVAATIRELTDYNPETKEAGLLLSDSTIRGILNRMNSMLTGTVSGLTEGKTSGTLIELGFNFGDIGSLPGTTNDLQLNEGVLRDALRDTPTRVAEIFGAEDLPDNEGIFEQFKTYFDSLSNATGIFNQRQKIGDDQIVDINDQITTLNSRLEKKRSLLELQFTNMEKALLDSQSQQNALAGLIAGIGGGQ